MGDVRHAHGNESVAIRSFASLGRSPIINHPSDIRHPTSHIAHRTSNIMLTLTREQVRQIDRLAIEELGIPGVVLMENAGRNAAEVVLDMIESELQMVAQDAKVAILCGGGNNGGDGYVIARHLSNAGVRVVACAIKPIDDLTGDAAVHARVAERMGLVKPCAGPELLHGELDALGPNIVVDALLGTGFEGQVRDDLAAVIDICNALREAGASVVAVDVPSGLDCDTGEPANATVAADVTVTFVAVKSGFAQPAAEAWVGRVVPVDIGTPPSLIGRVLRA